MKQFKAKTVAAILTASMALGMTGCTIEVDGDVKQVESLLANVAQNYQTSPSDQNSPEKQDQTTQSDVFDEYGNVVKTEESLESKQSDPVSGSKQSSGNPKGSASGTKVYPSSTGNAPAPVKVEESEVEAVTDAAPEASRETVVSSEEPKAEEVKVPSETKETEVSN